VTPSNPRRPLLVRRWLAFIAVAPLGIGSDLEQRD
jgi:hypothetical protein